MMNAKHSSKTRYGYGNNACFDAGLFNNQASSLRYTGAPDDMYHDTVCITINVKFVKKWPYATHRAGVRSANRYYVVPEFCQNCLQVVTVWSQSCPNLLPIFPQVGPNLCRNCLQVVTK